MPTDCRSRGGLVDEAALADLIRLGHLAGAGIDTFEQEPPSPDNPLLALDAVLVSPHAAHYSTQSYAEVRNKVFADVASVLRGGSRYIRPTGYERSRPQIAQPRFGLSRRSTM
jgi:phosphoglycerate dehydrogenase-like enzyme